VAGQTELKDDAALTAVMADDRDESPVTPAFNHSPTPVSTNILTSIYHITHHH